MKKLIELFLTMLKIGTFTFGGGYAMISLIQKEKNLSGEEGYEQGEDKEKDVCLYVQQAFVYSGFRHGSG